MRCALNNEKMRYERNIMMQSVKGDSPGCSNVAKSNNRAQPAHSYTCTCISFKTLTVCADNAPLLPTFRLRNGNFDHKRLTIWQIARSWMPLLMSSFKPAFQQHALNLLGPMMLTVIVGLYWLLVTSSQYKPTIIVSQILEHESFCTLPCLHCCARGQFKPFVSRVV